LREGDDPREEEFHNMFCDEHDTRYRDARNAEVFDLMEVLSEVCWATTFEEHSDVVHMGLLKAFAAGVTFRAFVALDGSEKVQAAE
jgi:hypothetical protein